MEMTKNSYFSSIYLLCDEYDEYEYLMQLFLFSTLP